MRAGKSMLVLTVFCLAAHAADAQIGVTAQRRLQPFNAEVLGTRVGDSIKPLDRAGPTDVTASSVALHVTSNRYDSVTILYPREMTAEEAVQSIQTSFPQCRRVEEGAGGTRNWKDAETGLTISFSVAETAYQVVYSGSRPPRKAKLKDLPETRKKVTLESL